MEFTLHVFLTSAWMEVSDQPDAQAAFTSVEENPRYIPYSALEAVCSPDLLWMQWQKVSIVHTGRRE
jgi:hypothetical protein